MVVVVVVGLGTRKYSTTILDSAYDNSVEEGGSHLEITSNSVTLHLSSLYTFRVH